MSMITVFPAMGYRLSVKKRSDPLVVILFLARKRIKKNFYTPQAETPGGIMRQGLPRLRRQETRLKAYQQVYLLRASQREALPSLFCSSAALP